MSSRRNRQAHIRVWSILNERRVRYLFFNVSFSFDNQGVTPSKGRTFKATKYLLDLSIQHYEYFKTGANKQRNKSLNPPATQSSRDKR